jgi:site-specific recombinase XerD
LPRDRLSASPFSPSRQRKGDRMGVFAFRLEHDDVYPKSHRTRPMSPAGIDQWFGRCVEAAGLSSYTMHQLRHAAIDQVRRATGDLEIARLLARHENVSVTQDYLHSTIDDLRAAIDGMVEGSV